MSVEKQEVIVHVHLGKYVVGAAIDREISRSDVSSNYSKYSARRYIFDFSESTFVSIACSQYVIAFAKKCRLLGWNFSLVLPKYKKVRDFWVLWNFHGGLLEATGIDISELIPANQQDLLKEEQITFFEQKKAFNVNQFERQRSRNFFGFHSIKLSGRATGMAAISEADQWRSKEIRDILERGLDTRSDYITSRIVFEAIFNAIKHPDAKLVQTCSWHPKLFKRVDGSDHEDARQPFSLVFWDDGKPFTIVMDAALKRGAKIRSTEDEQYRTSYRVEYINRAKNTEPFTKTIDSTYKLDANTPELMRLLSTVFPGVSTSQNSDEQLNDNDISSKSWISKRGMGLYVLVDTVCILLEGKVSFRTGRYFMQISKLGPRNSVKYGAELDVKIYMQADNVPSFYGNMLCVDLPAIKK